MSDGQGDRVSREIWLCGSMRAFKVCRGQNDKVFAQIARLMLPAALKETQTFTHRA